MPTVILGLTKEKAPVMGNKLKQLNIQLNCYLTISKFILMPRKCCYYLSDSNFKKCV